MPSIEVNPPLSPDQLFEFYARNGICEARYGKATAARILDHPHLIVAAFEGGELVGLARATFDGLSAHVMELSVDLRWQGKTRHRNGSLVEDDPKGLGTAMGSRLLRELSERGCRFVSGYIVAGREGSFYASLGFRENAGQVVYCIDERPYAKDAG